MYREHLAWEGFKLTALEMIGTDCLGSYKSIFIDYPRIHCKIIIKTPPTNVEKHNS